ncbi:Cytochrome heme-binding site [Cordyceps militaris]|uniref:Ceramide very long chain fatty acid hydroxylase n=1 Tax=Cordyceps militaris TaxID=73501 RepID=A0A2H4SUE8_CORMI|nr:Cytochrome heme-binding site [Cordyceps militaris]
MPSRTLPTFTAAEVATHSSAASCYVTIGNKVYDVTDFVDSHPGGADLLIDYAGRDVADILKDATSHPHSEAAYEVLDDSLVGFVRSPTADGPASEQEPGAHPRTGMSCEADLSVDTDTVADFKTHRFLDLGKPLFWQVWNGGFGKASYLEQVHRPRQYKGGASAPIFGNFLEPLTKTPWWMIPTVWLPCVLSGLYISNQGLQNPLAVASYWAFGLSLWSLIEYCMHRFLFHLDDHLPDNRVFITSHFLLHGIHHYLPMDRYRLVLPPALFLILAPPFWQLTRALFFYSKHAALAVYCGGVFGYICYDVTHYFLHHKNLPPWYKELKTYHLRHHFLDYEAGFGVTSRFWDRVFGTALVVPTKEA